MVHSARRRFALRFAVQLQLERAQVFRPYREDREDERLLPNPPTRFTLRRRSSDHSRGLTASTAPNRYPPTVERRAAGTCRRGAPHRLYGRAYISFCGYRRGRPPPFLWTRAVESAGSRGNGVCVYTFVEA